MGKGGRRRGRETSVWGCLSCAPTRHLAHNPGMHPDWESNWQPLGSQAISLSAELHQPGLELPFDPAIPLLGICPEKLETLI